MQRPFSYEVSGICQGLDALITNMLRVVIGIIGLDVGGNRLIRPASRLMISVL